ncbi:hypothetical protein AB9F45_18030 [Rhizobium leguminosarum]|uniref:hypothetical protein n=1 Tax=Rhizobium leguminosarum TaxID=384 RepID=UPI003F99E95C
MIILQVLEALILLRTDPALPPRIDPPLINVSRVVRWSSRCFLLCRFGFLSTSQRCSSNVCNGRGAQWHLGTTQDAGPEIGGDITVLGPCSANGREARHLKREWKIVQRIAGKFRDFKGDASF